MAKVDPAVRAHLDWIGYVQPTGLVVSAPALVRAGAILDRRDAEGQMLLRGCVEERAFDLKEGPAPWLPDFRVFAEQVLGWTFSPKGYAGTEESPIPPELEVPLAEYGETLRPDYAVRELAPVDGATPWQLLVRVLEPGPANMIFNEKTVVFRFEGYWAFALLQSRSHDVWARFFNTTMKDDMQYTLSACFETFPFPGSPDWQQCVEDVGREYHSMRAALMLRNHEGLTKTYNRFHDPEERDPDIKKLRELHAAMDRAVLDAYGWTDVPTDCEFLLDYEIDEEEWGKKKKPWRYRWPDEVRDEVLARLLELNAQRAREEERAGLSGKKKRSGKRGKKRGSGSPSQGDLFS